MGLHAPIYQFYEHRIEKVILELYIGTHYTSTIGEY